MAQLTRSLGARLAYRFGFCGLAAFGSVACGNDGSSDGAGTNATNTTSGGGTTSSRASGGSANTRQDTLGSGGVTAASSAIGGNGSSVGGGSATASGGTSLTGGTSSGIGTTAMGGKSASGGATNAAAGGATGGRSSSASTAIGGAASGGRSGTSSTATGGASVGGKSAAGGTASSSTAQGGAGGKSTSSNATGGRSAAGGSTTVAIGGSATGGTMAGTTPALDCNSTLPAYTTSSTVSATITITGTKDYGMQRFCADPTALGKGDQSENQKPIFQLAKGAVLKNVIIGGSGCSAADGIHCEAGSCTLENVWIGDVGEDAISFKGNDPNQVMTINGGGAFEADDKVIQHNGPGKILINGFFVKNAGKLYRSCGNCGTQYDRHIELTNVFASGIRSTLVGINYNLGDTATIHSLTRCGTVKVVCETFTGNDTGDEPTAKDSYTTAGDGKYCIYTAANILK